MTDKQKEMLTKLGVTEYDPNLSNKDAARLISDCKFKKEGWSYGKTGSSRIFYSAVGLKNEKR